MQDKNRYIIAFSLILGGILLGLGVLYYGSQKAKEMEANLPDNLPQPPQEEDIKDINIEAEGHPVVGEEEAPITIIAINDFQCPFCKDFALQTMPDLKEKYIDEGKVRFVFRDFPLPYHPEAQKAAEATLCFYDQGLEYYDYYVKLFENPTKLKIEDLQDHAETLEANMEKFNACLNEEKFSEGVKKDFEEINQIVQQANIENFGTPAFFINQEPLIGAHDFKTFKAIIEKKLNEIDSN